ncbi:MAG: histidine--tRNA ligase [Candidatus Omnitrophica bacterium CG07_land_8_20_14_0_80_50_8]|nr:MAG: histidine--tRNA ligase [Candidatus Omnitrophica bacterium CG1_02_49_16]PIU40396.1 MAG: histidine--tRNA ligase [Candidatus Omnitrophica bacterium CG07_land_8_20_14_0_80_50_8]
MKFQRLRGTHDIYGKNALLFERVESGARQIFRRFGFAELRTPILEARELFSRALGTETDVVQKEMYEFEDRSKLAVAMRPEGTAGIVRAYLENDLDKTQGLSKFFYLGPMFRSERPQAGRLRQFHQIGVEELGTDSPYADAEVLHALLLFLDALGVKGCTLKINNLGTFEERKTWYSGGLTLYFKNHYERLCPDCQSRLTKNILRILDCKVSSCREIVLKSPSILAFLGDESKNHFSKFKDALNALDVSCLADAQAMVDPYLVRGLDYYTRTVFEISHPKLGAQDALAAGGRYDHLIESFGGCPAGAVGFAIGVERLLMCLSDQAEKDEAHKLFFIVTLGEQALTEGFKMLCGLRNLGLQVFMDFAAKSLKSQMRAADKVKADFVLILGDDELKKNICTLKDMKTGEQKEIALEDAVVSLATEK